MKPGVKTIIAGAVLFLVGAFVVSLLGILPLLLGDSHAVQFKVPGSIEVAVKDAGRYYLWNDFQTVYNGKSYNRPENVPDGMDIQIRDANGHPLQFFSNVSMSVSSQSSSRKSIGYVEVQQPGKLTITVSGGDEERIFSFSKSGFLKIAGLIAGGFGLATLFGLTGFGLIIWGIVKLVRGNAKGVRPPSLPQ